MTWTDDRVDTLKRLWGEGCSASQIAAELGGVTRNAVIGKVHRLSLEGRKPPGTSVRTRQRKARATMMTDCLPVKLAAPATPTSVPRPVVALRPRPLDQLSVPAARLLSIMELSDKTCKWPVGDPQHPGFGFCGHKPFNLSVYCEYHTRLAYQPVEARTRSASRHPGGVEAMLRGMGA